VLLTFEPRVHPQLFRLDVPGLAEKRPSLLRNDKVELELDGRQHRGKIWFVNLDHVLLSLHRSVRKQNLRCARVHFVFSRTPFRLMHRALEDALPFVSPPPPLEPSSSPVTNGVNPLFKPNTEQSRVIDAILQGSPTPILVWGPPGEHSSFSYCLDLTPLVSFFVVVVILLAASI
jgi:hypothetical protein